MYIDLLCGIVSCSSGSWAPLWVRFMGQSRSWSAVGKSVIRMCASRIRPWVTEPGRKNDEAQGIKDEWPIPTQCNPNQASSITPTITSTYFKFLWLFFFFSSYNSTLDRNHGNCGSPDGNLAAQHASWTTTMTFRVLQYEIDLLANLVVSSGIFECYLTLPLQTSSPNLSCALWPNRLALVAHRNLSIPELHQIAAFVSERSRQSQPFTNQPMATSLGLFMLGSYVQVRSAPHLLLHSIAQGFAAR